MDIKTLVSGSLASLQNGAHKRGYDKGYEQGVADTLAEIEAQATVEPEPKAKPRPKKKATAKIVRQGATKTDRAAEVIRSLPAVGKLRRTTINEAVSQAGGLSKADAGNAITKMVRKGELEMLEGGEGYMLKLPPVANGAEQHV